MSEGASNKHDVEIARVRAAADVRIATLQFAFRSVVALLSATTTAVLPFLIWLPR